VQAGVEELDQSKFAPLLKWKYFNAISDTMVVGGPKQTRIIFSAFQQFPYQSTA